MGSTYILEPSNRAHQYNLRQQYSRHVVAVLDGWDGATQEDLIQLAWEKVLDPSKVETILFRKRRT